MKKLFIITGEYSADQHASYVVKELKTVMPEIEIEAIGGTNLSECGIKLFADHSKMNVVGMNVKAIIDHINLGARLLKYLKNEFKPDAVLLLDYGGFNLRMATQLHRLNIPCYYYICPQIWATRKHRINDIKKYVKKVFLTLPFEKEIYDKEGIPSKYVGHPLISQLPEKADRKEFIRQNNLDEDKKIIGVFPGSRKFEIDYLMPTFLKAVDILRQKSDKLQFCIAQAPTLSDELLDKYLKNRDIKVLKNQNHALLSCSDSLILASGTVALEAAIYQTPMLISYRGPWLFYLGYLVIRYLKFVSLPNIISGKEIIKELIQHKSDAKLIADEVYDLTFNQQRRDKMIEELKQMRELLEEKVSSKEVALALKEELSFGK